LELITGIIDYFAVARGGIEPPTHVFSVHTFILSPINLVICRADYWCATNCPWLGVHFNHTILKLSQQLLIKLI